MRLSAVAFLLVISTSNAFIQQRQFVVPYNKHGHVLYNTPTEKTLRKELEEKNSAVKNEEKYSVMDGANMEGAFTDSVVPVQIRSDRTSLAAKMDRMTKPRAYPLFLAEKAAEFVESTFMKRPSYTLTTSRGKVGTKEKIVVLGTGWGAASFVKEIDTDRYDVTVISPRNYFLFTPMLAGASVGTVEFRSITEPIREVR